MFELYCYVPSSSTPISSSNRSYTHGRRSWQYLWYRDFGCHDIYRTFFFASGLFDLRRNIFARSPSRFHAAATVQPWQSAATGYHPTPPLSCLSSPLRRRRRGRAWAQGSLSFLSPALGLFFAGLLLPPLALDDMTEVPCPQHEVGQVMFSCVQMFSQATLRGLWPTLHSLPS